MRLKLISGRKPILCSLIGNRVTSCSRSVTICVCGAQMDTSKSPRSSAIVKKSVPFLPFSGVPLALDTSITHLRADTSHGVSLSDQQQAPTTIDAEAAESSLKSLLGIGSIVQATERVAFKDVAYGPPKSQAFQPRGSDVSTEDPAILDWNFEQKEKASPKEERANLQKELTVEIQISAMEKSAEETSIMEMNLQIVVESSADTVSNQSIEHNHEDVAATEDCTSSCCTMETSTPILDRSKLARGKRRRCRKKRTVAAALASFTELQTSKSEFEGLSSKEHSNEEVSVTKKESEGEDCLLAQLPQLLDSSGESESEGSVYSLKPLFAGSFDTASQRGRGRKRPCSDSADKRQRPNYFVAIQIKNREIHENVQEVLDHICSCEPTISKAMVATPTLHLTMLVLRVSDDDGSLERAKDALARSYDLIKEDLNSKPLVLKFKGLGHFRNEVLFTKVEGEESKERLKNIVDVCLKEFSSSNLDLSVQKEFTPHLTLMKLSKTSKRSCKIRKIQKEWYEKFAEEDFGSQAVFSIQLLSMNKPKDEDGYYYCSQECRFEGVPVEESRSTPTGASSGSSPRAKKKLLELESAKEDIRRSISSLTKAKLKEISAATAEHGVMQIDQEATDKEERTGDGLTTGATDAASAAKTEPREVTCDAPPDN